MQYFKTKYYPVNIDDKVIYNDPQKTEGACSVGRKYSLRETGTIGIKGTRLSECPCYRQYEVRTAIAQ
ncbi:MAG TPA: hypothetical protein DCZ10_11335 [Pelotomaculum sp.]|nr:hypothetical protein [Pelotomaculum sp.]